MSGHFSIADSFGPNAVFSISIHADKAELAIYHRVSDSIKATFIAVFTDPSDGYALATHVCQTGEYRPFLDWLAGEWRDRHTSAVDVIDGITKLALQNEREIA